MYYQDALHTTIHMIIHIFYYHFFTFDLFYHIYTIHTKVYFGRGNENGLHT